MIRPISVTPKIIKNDGTPVLLIKCQCQREFESDTTDPHANCPSCGQELNWGLRR